MRKSLPLFLGLRLLIICLAAGFLLGLVYNITLPYKEAADAAALQESLEAVCPGGTFVEVDLTGLSIENAEDVQHLYTYEKEGRTGYVAVTCSMGYKGDVNITVSIADDGTVQAIAIGSHEETAGIGSRIENEDFLAQFEGVSAPAEGAVDTISGASYSSRAVIAAVDLAFEAVEAVKGA